MPFLRLGAADMGSNAIRLVVAERTETGALVELAAERVPVRLGHDVYRSGRLEASRIANAVEAMAGFRDMLERFAAERFRAVATSAVRESANRDELVRRVRDEAGILLEVVTEAEEARLVCVAAAARLPVGDDPWILADLGGGSLEVAVFDAHGVRTWASYPLGAVRLLEELGPEGDETRLAALVDQRLSAVRLPPGSDDARGGLAATGGNIETLARLAGAGGRMPVIGVEDLETLVARLAEASVAERQRRWGLEENRADVIVPAGLVYAGIARLAGRAAIHVPRVGVKEGLLRDLARG